MVDRLYLFFPYIVAVICQHMGTNAYSDPIPIWKEYKLGGQIDYTFDGLTTLVTTRMSVLMGLRRDRLYRVLTQCSHLIKLTA